MWSLLGQPKSQLSVRQCLGPCKAGLRPAHEGQSSRRYDLNMFRRRKKDPLAAYELARPEDRQVLAALLNAGADLTRPRHVLHFIYELADESSARKTAEAVGGWDATAKPPPEGYDTWSVTFERHNHLLSPENVASDASTFTSVAEAHGGHYDGWEASV